LIEDKANGSALIDDLDRSYNGIPLIPYNPQASKYERASLAAPSWRAGLCYLPEHEPWVSDFVAQHVSFGPGADHDDEVDAMSQIFIYWQDGVSPEDQLKRAFAWVDALENLA
jgi:predicted phage terminase large subunit-like protein